MTAKFKLAILALCLTVLACNSETVLTVTPSPEPTPEFTGSASATDTPTASETATATATLPAPTLEFVSPTPLANSTPGGIIEVTAIGGVPVQGWFTPYTTMNIRTCAAITCSVWRQTAGGATLRVYDVFIDKEDGSTWLALDPAGNTWIAYLIGGTNFGEWGPD